jgi:excisionase family DNA binding protein
VTVTDKDETATRDFLTVNEAAKVLRVSRRTVYRLVETGKMPANKVGRRLRISRAGLEEFVGVPKPKA